MRNLSLLCAVALLLAGCLAQSTPTPAPIPLVAGLKYWDLVLIEWSDE